MLPPLLEWIPRASPHLAAPSHLAPLAEQLERVLRGESIELCVSVPPRHGKTTTVVHWIVWLLAQRPDLQVLYCSFGDKMARKQTRAMRALARRIGLPLGEVQTAGEWTTASGGRVRSCGITGAPTGDGFDLIAVDDAHRNRRAAESATERDSVVAAYLSDIYTRQLPRGTSHLIMATRWHTDDLTGVMTRERGDEDDGPKPFALINLPALSPSEEALAPWLWDAARLRRIRSRVGAYAWASLYQGSPKPRGGALFGAATWTDSPPMVASYAGGVDLARTAKRRSDHQAAVMMARAPDGSIVIVDAANERALLTDRTNADTGALEEGFTRELHALQRRWRGASLRMYTGRDESSILDLLAMHREYPVRVRAVVAREDKWERAQGFAAAWNAGRVSVLVGCRCADELVRQLGRFTGLDGDTDDLVDAAVAAFDEIDVGVFGGQTVTPAEQREALRPAMRAATQRWT